MYFERYGKWPEIKLVKKLRPWLKAGACVVALLAGLGMLSGHLGRGGQTLGGAPSVVATEDASTVLPLLQQQRDAARAARLAKFDTGSKGPIVPMFGAILSVMRGQAGARKTLRGDICIRRHIAKRAGTVLEHTVKSHRAGNTEALQHFLLQHAFHHIGVPFT